MGGGEGGMPQGISLAATIATPERCVGGDLTCEVLTLAQTREVELTGSVKVDREAGRAEVSLALH